MLSRDQLFGGRICAAYLGVTAVIGSFSDEDVESAERDDGELDSIGPCRNLAPIWWNEGETSIVLDASDGDRVADACKGGTRPVPASRRRRPHGGRHRY